MWWVVIMNLGQLECLKLLQGWTEKPIGFTQSVLVFFLLCVAVPLLVLRSAGCWQPISYRWLQLRSKCAWTGSVWPSIASLTFTQVGKMCACSMTTVWTLWKPWDCIRAFSSIEKLVAFPSVLNLNYFLIAYSTSKSIFVSESTWMF